MAAVRGRKGNGFAVKVRHKFLLFQSGLLGRLLLCFGGQSRHYAGKQNGKEHRQDGKQKPALVRAIQDVVRECIAKDLESKSVNSVNFQRASVQERTAADDLRGNFIQAGGQQGQYNTQSRCNQDKRKPIQTIGPNTVIRDALDYVHQKPPAKTGKRNKRGGQSGRDFFVPGTVIGKTNAEEKKRQSRSRISEKNGTENAAQRKNSRIFLRRDAF